MKSLDLCLCHKLIYTIATLYLANLDWLFLLENTCSYNQIASLNHARPTKIIETSHQVLFSAKDLFEKHLKNAYM